MNMMIDSTPETTSSESELEDNLVPLQHNSSSQQQTGTKCLVVLSSAA
jgi:hypothetical protein